jgi:hypothetical protein
MGEPGYGVGLKDKLMNQMSLVLNGSDCVSDGGSFAPAGGILGYDPIRAASCASMVCTTNRHLLQPPRLR